METHELVAGKTDSLLALLKVDEDFGHLNVHQIIWKAVEAISLLAPLKLCGDTVLI